MVPGSPSPDPDQVPESAPAAAVTDTVAAPHEGLSTRAVAYWRASSALRAVPIAIVVTALALALPSLPSVLRALVVAGAWLAVAVGVVVLPPIRRRTWWFAVGDEEVDLHHGLLTVTHTVVPMVRVQHVDLHRNALADRFGLAEIELHTAAGSLTIPALDRDQAERIRRQVAVLARVPDEV